MLVAAFLHHRKRDNELAAFANALAACPDAASVHFSELARQRQADAKPAGDLARRLAALFEHLEDTLGRGRFEADAGIPHVDLERAIVNHGLYGDRAFQRREL